MFLVQNVIESIIFGSKSVISSLFLKDKIDGAITFFHVMSCFSVPS